MRTIFVDRTVEMRRVIQTWDLPAPGHIVINEGNPTAADLNRICKGAQVILVEHTVLPREVFDECPSVRAVVFMGTGAESYIDLDYARQRGIRVLTTPGYGDRAVAEHALALMLSAARNVTRMDRDIRSGQWNPMGGLQLQGRKLAVVGLGGIGSAFADLATALGMRVAAWNRTRRDHPAYRPDLDAVLMDAEVVSLHLALNAETREIIDDRRIRLPRKGFILVNTARAQLIREPALLDGLASGRIGHAALDVFHEEPLGPGNAYIRLPNVTLTPHAAYMTDDAYAELWKRTLLALASLEQN